MKTDPVDAGFVGIWLGMGLISYTQKPGLSSIVDAKHLFIASVAIYVTIQLVDLVTIVFKAWTRGK